MIRTRMSVYLIVYSTSDDVFQNLRSAVLDILLRCLVIFNVATLIDAIARLLYMFLFVNISKENTINQTILPLVLRVIF